MNKADIDRTHIIALQEVGGRLRNVELPVSRPDQFIAEFRAMVDNPNRSVWDMQSTFAEHYPKTNNYFDYLQPYSYNIAYVSGVNYPTFHEYSELQRSWQEAGETARRSYNGTCMDSTNVTESMQKAINELKRRQKHYFLADALRWIDACCYYETANRLNRDNSVKMFSKENVGWNNFTHKVNDDIKVALKTNFGYGSAAHFILALQYKGINILPYSYIVKYYNARMVDIVHCTRSYEPCRESWAASFDFISDFVNKSIADPETFVKSYVMKEVREMIKGLEAIATNPLNVIKEIGNKKADPFIINVQPMFEDDKIRMQSYPEETPILFKVEKINGALDFLENLTEIAKEVDCIRPYIDRLLELNMKLCPEVQDAIERIKNKIEPRAKEKENLESRIADISEKIRPYEEEIQQGYATQTSEKPFNINEYEATHQEYVRLRNERNTLKSKLSEVNRLINDLNSFIGVLNRSLTRLEEVNQAKQAA